MEQALKYWPVIVVITNILAMWVWWSAKKSFSTHADVSNLGKQLTQQITDNEKKTDLILVDHNNRLIRVEEAIKSAPTHGDIERVYERLNSINASVQSVSGEVKGVSGELSAVRRSVDMMNQYLLGGNP